MKMGHFKILVALLAVAALALVHGQNNNNFGSRRFITNTKTITNNTFNSGGSNGATTSNYSAPVTNSYYGPESDAYGNNT